MNCEITKELLEKEIKRCEDIIKEKRKEGKLGTSYWSAKIAELHLLLMVMEKGYEKAVSEYYDCCYNRFK